MSHEIRVERNGQRIELRGWIGTQTPTLCKAVGAGRWNPDSKFWSYPLDYGVCLSLREQFGDHLAIGPELAAWAREARDARAALAKLSSQTEAALHNVERHAPRIAAAMASRTYQQVGAAFGARAGSFGLFDQPGLGKTITALGSIVEARGGEPGLHLVLCPKVAVETVWAAEIAQWLPEAEVWPLTGPRARRERDLWDALHVANRGRNQFVIGNIEMARVNKTTERAEYPELFGVQWDTVIIDESHRALVRKSVASESAQRFGISRLKSTRRIALSGTPMRGKPENLWGTLNWLRPDVYTSYWNWAKTYYSFTSNGFSNYVLDGFRSGGEQQLAEDMRTVSLRRTKAEVLAELPAKQYGGTYLIPGDTNSPHAVWLPMDGKQASAYKRFEREAAISIDGRDLIADGVLAEMTRLKQFAGSCIEIDDDDRVVPVLPSNKYEWLLGKLDELGIVDGEGDARIVVASQFTKLLNTVAAALREAGIECHVLTGETADAKRKAMVADFQGGGTARVFLLNTMAGGVAVTLDAADDLVLLDETYNPDDQEQVEDRIHRTSRIHQVTIHHLRSLGTIEEEIAWITAARESVQKYLLDGSRGIDAARKLYEAKNAA